MGLNLLLHSTPLHIAIMAKNSELFDLLLREESIEVNAKTAEGYPPLWYALHQAQPTSEDSFARKLVNKGAKPDLVSFLHPFYKFIFTVY